MTINLDQYTNTLSVTDTAANADLNVTTKGTGAVNLNTGNGTAVRIADFSATTVAGLGIFAGSSGQNTVYVSPYGSGAGSNLVLASKGTGFLILATNTSNNAFITEQMRVTHTASAVNYIQATGSATGAGVTLSAQGSDSNIQFYYVSKGTFPHSFLNSAGNEQFRIAPTASAVNYVQVTGNATGGGPSLSAQGSDSNVSLVYIGKGIGGHVFTSGNGANIQLVINNTTSAVNYHQFTGSATGSSPIHSVAGSDTNIDLTLTPKGTGNVRFGTYTGTILTPTGYVEIKDSSGTVRRLLVG
jgi:hypothetical protein